MENLVMASTRTAGPAADFWRGKRVVLTGHTGFKGGWMAHWLVRLGAYVTGFSLPPNTVPNLFEAARIGEHVSSHFGDIRDADKVAALMASAKPDIVFHMAAQPLVRESYRTPVETFAANVMGTVHVLDALRRISSCKVAVMITTDKVYQNREWIYPYREDDALGGHDPYSASKAACEIAIASYRMSFLEQQGLGLASVRAGNVIGGGDWSADRLIPDAVRAWQNGQPLQIRRPDAVRPWQHVLEPLNAYLVLAEKLWSDPSLSSAFNIGPNSGDMTSVRTIVTMAREAFGKGSVLFDETVQGPHEAGLLALETAKSQALLGIKPRWSLETTIQNTMKWYASFNAGSTGVDLCDADIEAFEQDKIKYSEGQTL